MDYIVRPTIPGDWPEEKRTNEKATKPLKIHEKIQSLKTPKRSKSRAVAIGINKLNK